jgi:hypothetical protein
VESYLAVKYGITLSPTVTNYVNSSGSVIWNNTTYWHDVFGIGKDDGSGLNQPQSNSINSGSGDGTGQSGKGNIVLSNASSLNNNDFLIIGHDNGALAEQVTDIPASLNLGSKRLQREWKAKHTGNVGTVTIKFDMNGVTQTGVTAANFKLMIDTDGNGDFTNGTVTLADAASYTGGIVTFNGVSIPDGAVFTLKTGFAPSPGVPGSTLWVKSNAGTSPASGTLTSWTDQDGINTFTVSGNPQTGVNKINYNNVIDFDGAGDYITGNSAIVFQTLYAVLKQNTTSGTSTVMSASNGNQNLGFMMKGNNMATGDNQSGANNDAFQSTGSLGTAPSIGVVEIKTNALPEACQSYINGKNYATTRFAGTNGTLSPFASIPFIGRSQSNSAFDYFNGQLAELIMYPASHTNDQRRTIESYLAVKYGISLDPSFGNWTSSDGTIIWNVTNNNLYNNDVFGIGRDIATGLNQPASNSMNSGSGDGVGQTAKANIVIKAPSSLDDKDYLMIGHNGIAAVEAQPADPEYDDLPSRLMGKGVTRLRREWKVQRTGDVGSITLEIDLNGINTTGDLPGSTSNPAGNLADFGIVIDLDGDGDFTTGTVLTRTPNSFGSPKLIFNTQDLPNNAVFTIATNGGGNILPVMLTNFDGVATECSAGLQWQAATESNLKQYEVQLSENAQTNWNSIATIKAKNSNNSRYAFNAGMTQGKAQYFRLKMTDNDGTVSYSKVVSLQCAANNAYTIYPNPASSRISITGTKAGQQLQVIAFDGKVMQMHLANEGNTSIGINALPAGTYLIRIGTNGQWTEAGRFVKQ